MLIPLNNIRNYGIIAVLTAVAFFLTWDYFKPSLQIFLGLMCVPFIFHVREKSVYSHRYGILSLLFILGYLLLQIKVLLFLSVGCLIFYSVESLLGKMGMLPLLFLLFLSPTVEYLSNIFTFSLRLAISEHVALLLSKGGIHVENHGSYFQMEDGSMFSVDSACLGLNLIRTGLCITVLLIAFAENNMKKSTNLAAISMLTFVSLSLLVLANFIRIAALVLFQSAPETFSHNFIGILSLLLYMALPMYFITRYSVKRFGADHGISTIKKTSHPLKGRIITLAFFSLVVIFTGRYVTKTREEKIYDEKLQSLELEGYSRSRKDLQVMEYRDAHSLIYIKPGVRGYQTDHSPTICWQGHGFELCSFKTQAIGRHTIMTGELKMGDIIQYTAWWYDNGKHKTVDQWEWRLSKGEPYRLINITTQSKEELEILCHNFLERKLF